MRIRLHPYASRSDDRDIPLSERPAREPSDARLFWMRARRAPSHKVRLTWTPNDMATVLGIARRRRWI